MAALYFYVCFMLKLTFVAGQSVHYVLKGRQAILSPTLPGAPDDILWKHNGDKVITFDSAEERVFPPYEGRVTLSWSTAEMTITDMGFEDSGEYELDAFIRERLHRSQYMLKVLDKVSKPVIQCEMKDDSNNSSIRRATLHCSSDSNTPEALTFKWNLEGKSHVGQDLTVALGTEYDHMEYSCTATNPLHGETSIFMAKDCYTDANPEALDIIVPIVIAALILLAFGILAFIFRYQIKRGCEACLKIGSNDDVEKQKTVADSKNKEEGTPLMGDIHRQETFASKQPLIQKIDYVRETPQKQDEENDMNTSEMATPPLISNGQVESEKETNLSHEDINVLNLEGGTDADSTHSSQYHEALQDPESQDSLPGELQGREQTEGEPVVQQSEDEGGPNTDGDDSSFADSDREEATKTPEQAVPDSQPKLPHQTNAPALEHNSVSEQDEPESEEQTASNEDSTPVHGVKDPSTDASQNASVTSVHIETEKTELTNSQMSPPQSEPPGSKDSPLNPGEHEHRGQTDSDREPDENHSDHEGGPNTNASDDSSFAHSDKEEAATTPEQADSQLCHRSSEPEDLQSSQDTPEKEEQVDPGEDLTPSPQKDASRNESVTSNDNEHDDSQMSPSHSEQSEPELHSPPQTSPPPADEGSTSGTVEFKDKKKTDPDDKLKTADEETQRDPSGNEGVTSEHEAESPPQSPLQRSSDSVHNSQPVEQTNPDPEDDGQQTDSDHESESSDTKEEKAEDTAQPDARPPPTEPPVAVNASPEPELKQNADSGADVEAAKGKAASDSSTDEEQQKQDSSVEESEESKQTSPTAITPTADSELAGSAKESDESTHPPASALSQPVHNKQSKDTDAEIASTAQVSEETKENTDKESDSSGSEQINEATKSKEGQQ